MSIKPSQTKMLKTEMVVGIFFIIALAILGYFTIILNPETAFTDTYELKVSFKDNTGNLKNGSNVRVKGVIIGRVTDINISDDYESVLVTLRLTEKPTLYKGCKATVEASSFLGGEYLKIHLGDPALGPFPEGEWLVGETPKDLMGDAAEIVSRVNLELQDGKIFADLKQTLTNLRESSDGMSEFFENLKNEESTLGQLILKPDTRLKNLDNLFATFEQAGLNIKDAGAEVADAGRSVKDAADELKKFGTNINEVIDDAKKGKGLLGKIISDEAGSKAWSDVEKAIANLTEFSEKLNSENSTIGKLVSNDEIYNTFKDTVTNLFEITDKINNSEGTLSRLINDPEAYNDLKSILKEGKKTLSEVQHAIQDFREQAPISTFGGIIFGTL